MFTLTKINVMWEKLLALTKKVNAMDVEIPDHGAGDAGKYLGVDSSGDLEFSDPLPATTDASAGDVLGLVGENKAKGWITPYTPSDYSTTEHDTGVKWVDGKEIYRKAWSGLSPTEGNTQINIGVVDKIISIRGTHGQTNNRYYDFGYDFRSSYYDGVAGIFYLIASSNEQFQNVPIQLIFEFTKPDPVPDVETRKKKTTKKEED